MRAMSGGSRRWLRASITLFGVVVALLVPHAARADEGEEEGVCRHSLHFEYGEELVTVMGTVELGCRDPELPGVRIEASLDRCPAAVDPCARTTKVAECDAFRCEVVLQLERPLVERSRYTPTVHWETTLEPAQQGDVTVSPVNCTSVLVSLGCDTLAVT